MSELNRAEGARIVGALSEMKIAEQADASATRLAKQEIEFGAGLLLDRMAEPSDSAPYSPPIPQSNFQTVPPASVSEQAAQVSHKSTANTASELLSKALHREPSQTTADVLAAATKRQPAPEIADPDAGQLDNQLVTVARLRQQVAVERQQSYERQQENERGQAVYRKAEQAARRLANLERAYANRRPYPVSDDYSMEEIRRVAKSAERDFAMQDAIEKARAEAATAQEIADVHAQISATRRELRRELAEFRGGR